MSIENSIPNIRKAIDEGAERMANNELLERPEKRHYEAMLQNFKLIRELSPEILEKVIISLSKTKDIKFELGPQLSSLFYNTWDEKSKGCEAVITSAMKQVQQTRNLTSDELKIEFSNLVQRVFEKIGNEVVNDNRITSAFLGKEELLDKAISFTKKQVPELLNDYNEFAQV